MNTLLVSIIIPTYNRKKSAERLINSLLSSTYKNIEVIVIDDASKDNTFDYLKTKFGQNRKVKIFRNKKNLFAAGSKNEGQKKAKGKFLAFIDDDNVVERRMIENLVKVLIAHEDVGEVGPINFSYNKKNSVLLTRSTRNMWTTKTLHLRTLKPFGNKKTWSTDDIPNAFMVKGDIVRGNKIFFKEEYGIMYEESDYAYRIKEAGYKIFMVRDARIYHDTDDFKNKGKSKDYLYHFMSDPRRPFTFARNRIIFHNLYSTKVQNIFILLFWIWVFTIYYSYKFLFYSGYGNFNLFERINVVSKYLSGNFKGLAIILGGTR